MERTKTMSMTKPAVCLLACLAALAAGPAPAELVADGQWLDIQADRELPAPLEWEHAARICDAAGNPVTGEQTVVASLYASETDGEVLWARKAPVLLDGEGNFSLRLSDALEVPDGAPSNTLADALSASSCWIGCALEGNAEAMSPRAAVAAAPYALFAGGASAAPGDFAAAVSLVVAGTASADSFSARSAESKAVDVSGALSVGGDVSLAGGLSAGSFSGIGAVPVGTIILWSGDAADVPDGWAICNGENGTPDFRGRFAVGAGKCYQPGETGGASEVTLETKHLPKHSHGYELRDDGNRDSPNPAIGNDGIWHADKTVQTGSAGGTEAHENRPAFKALHHIMRVE